MLIYMYMVINIKRKRKSFVIGNENKIECLFSNVWSWIKITINFHINDELYKIQLGLRRHCFASVSNSLNCKSDYSLCRWCHIALRCRMGTPNKFVGVLMKNNSLKNAIGKLSKVLYCLIDVYISKFQHYNKNM